jgi:Mor family transcriptional regulator
MLTPWANVGCCDPLPRGIRGRSFPQVLFSVAFAMAISYRGLELPQSPVSDGTLSKCKRNAEIRARHKNGESIATLAEVFGITEQRIWQILNDRRK